MATWDDLNSKRITSTSNTGSAWAAFNSKSRDESLKKESQAQKNIDPSLYRNLRERDVFSSDIRSQFKKPEKITFGQAVKDEAKSTVSGVFNQAVRNVRGTTQLLATPFASAFALPKGGVTPSEAKAESLSMAKELFFNPEKKVSEDIDKAGQRYLKSRKIGIYGGNEVKGRDIAVLGAIGLFDVLGDPLFEAGLTLRGAKGLKEFAQFKKVGSIKKALPKNTTFVKGKTAPLDLKVTDDLKIKVKPKQKSIVFEGYKKRFSKQKALPDSKLADETAEIISDIRSQTGSELKAKFVGDDLIVTPTNPIKKPGALQAGLKGVKNTADKQGVFAKQYETIAGGAKAESNAPASVGGLQEEITPTKQGVFARQASLPNIGVTPQSKKSGVKPTSSSVAPSPREEIVSVPRENIPVGAGPEKVSRLQQRVKETIKNVPEEIREFIGESNYNQLSKAENIKAATEYVTKSPDEALEVLQGVRQAPKGVLNNAIYVAMLNQAKGDVQLATKLASIRSTRLGQEISILTEIDPNSPVTAINRLITVREKAFEKTTKSKVGRAKQKVRSEIKKTIKKEAPKLDAWEEFIQEITC